MEEGLSRIIGVSFEILHIWRRRPQYVYGPFNYQFSQWVQAFVFDNTKKSDFTECLRQRLADRFTALSTQFRSYRAFKVELYYKINTNYSQVWSPPLA